ncbi:MAG: helix-turn-helix domain-containing protein [Eubacterium sp.]|nr:helix-turn-helix domain-containing protein [Eubacterium sp.]
MVTFAERLCEALEKRNMRAADLARLSKTPESVISQYKKGMYQPKQKRTEQFAKILDVSVSWLMGADVPMENQSTATIKFNYPDVSDDYIEFPVIGEVAAGFDKIAVEEWTEDKIKIHPDYLKGKSREDYFVLRVKGDSMYPLYLENDKVLVRRQNSVDYNGQIAVVIYGDDCGTIKKVEYRNDCIMLVPINPQVKPEKISDVEAEKLQVLGVPQLLVREIEE